MASKYDTAYFAGLADAKGCFSVYKRKTKNGYRYDVGLKVLSAYDKLPKFLLKHLGYGHVHSHYSKIQEREIWVWELFSQDLWRFLDTHLSFLRLKREQALCLLEFKVVHESLGTFESKLLKKKRLYEKCKRLKKQTRPIP